MIALVLAVALAGAPDDFELLEPAAPAAAAVDPELDAKIGQRRLMLSVHQGLGFGTLAALYATSVVGTLNVADLYGDGEGTGRFIVAHRVLAYATTALFALTASLALLAPTPFEKKGESGTTGWHKVLMAATTVGMVAQIVLGIVSKNLREGGVPGETIARIHQFAGYATAASMTGGMAVLFF